MVHMRAFEIHLNGKKLCVAGIERGTLLFSIGCSENKKGRGAVSLGMTGLKLNQETVRWQQRTLQLNDEVRIRIVEADALDKPEVLKPASRDTRKYEKAAVRRLAKEFGWTVQTGKRGKTVR